MIHISVPPLLAFFGLAFLPLFGHQHQLGHPNIQQRLHQIDVSLHLKQYEQLKMHAFEARMKLEMLNLNAVRDDELFHGKMLEKKVKVLEEKAKAIRNLLLQHAERSRQHSQEKRMHMSREKVCKGQKGSDEHRTAKQPQGKPKCQKSECNSKKPKQKK